MRMKTIVSGLIVLGAVLSTGVASARSVNFTHGRNSGFADTTDYWHIGAGANNDAVAALTGNAAYTSHVEAYDASQSWTSLNSNTMPVCALTNAMYNTPGTDIVMLTHSAGGNVAAYMLAVAQNGWASSCTHTPASAKAWATYFIPIAAPFRGSELADRVYGNTGGNFLQRICGSVAGSLANLLFNQASAMTWSLQTAIVQQNYGSLTAYGSYSAIWQNWGTSTSGDDSFGMSTATACGYMPSPHDGVVAQYSADYAIPGTHNGWNDAVGHSSNRRNDYRTFATNVWNSTPY